MSPDEDPTEPDATESIYNSPEEEAVHRWLLVSFDVDITQFAKLKVYPRALNFLQGTLSFWSSFSVPEGARERSDF